MLTSTTPSIQVSNPLSHSHIPSLTYSRASPPPPPPPTHSLTHFPIHSHPPTLPYPPPPPNPTPPDVKRGSQQYCGYHSGGYCTTSLAPTVVVQFSYIFDLTKDWGCDTAGTYSPTFSHRRSHPRTHPRTHLLTHHRTHLLTPSHPSSHTHSHRALSTHPPNTPSLTPSHTL